MPSNPTATAADRCTCSIYQPHAPWCAAVAEDGPVETTYAVTDEWRETAEFDTLDDAQNYVRDLYTMSEHLARMPEELQILKVERTVLETHKRPDRP